MENVQPTDAKLKADAAGLCSQYLHFWNQGEVEVTVILSRPGAQHVVYGTSVMSRDRLLHCLDAVRIESVIQGVLVNKHRLTR